ncbi:MAG: hypothetical protein PWP08_210 [Methanofollis sp.]|nr:hypothetical protein [Methanofollis sp.]
MNARGMALLCLALVGGACIAACCTGTPDESLPPEVSFTGETVRTGGTQDEIVVRYYPNSTEPSDYLVTFEISKGGTILDAVAGRAYPNVSAERPIELPVVAAGNDLPVTVDVTIYDRWGRAVHTSTTTLAAGRTGAA